MRAFPTTLALMCLFVFHSNAQVNYCEFGGSVGWTPSMKTHNSERELGVPFALSGYLEFHAFKHFSFITQPSFSRWVATPIQTYRFSDGPSINYPVEVQKVKYRYKMNTVRIPLIYCCEFGRQKWQRNSWQIFGGVHIGWNVHSTFTREWHSNGSVPTGWEESVNINQFLKRKWFLGGSCGVAFKFDLDPKTSLRFEYRAVWGRPNFKFDYEHTRDERAVVRPNDTYEPSRHYGQVRFPPGYHQLSVGYVFVRTSHRPRSFF